MVVNGKRFCAAFPLLRSLNPAHFEPHGLQSPCPDVGPREGSRQEEESETRHPKADHSMKVPQRGAAAKREARTDNARSTAAPRPPEIKTGHAHPNGPALERSETPPVGNAGDRTSDARRWRYPNKKHTT